MFEGKHITLPTSSMMIFTPLLFFLFLSSRRFGWLRYIAFCYSATLYNRDSRMATITTASMEPQEVEGDYTEPENQPQKRSFWLAIMLVLLTEMGSGFSLPLVN
jgi:hypothetical protein